MAFLLKLKWLNGPLAGRELSLPAGDTRLGGTDPDLALPLEHGQATVLTVTAAGLTLSPPLPVWVSGRPWDGSQPLPPGVVIDLAGLAFVLGAPDATLPALPVPPRRAARRTGLRQRALWLAAGIMATLAGLLGIWPQPATVGPVPLQTIDSPDPAPDGLQIEYDAQGVATLRGACASSDSVEKLRRHLRERGLPLRDESACADRLLDSVRHVLALNGYLDAEVSHGDNLDTVVIHGAIVADDGWRRTVRQLEAIKALRDWRVENDRASRFDQLLDLLARQSMLEGLSITLSGRALWVSGQLAPARETALLATLSAFNRRDPARLQARFQNLPAGRPDICMLPAAIVSLGGKAGSLYVELANGVRLRQGATLPSGYTIYILSPSAMALLKGQRLMSLPLKL